MENLPSSFHPSGKFQRIPAVEIGTPQRFKIPPGGLLHEVIVGFDPPLINADVATPIFVEVSVIAGYSKPESPSYVHSRIESITVEE